MHIDIRGMEQPFQQSSLPRNLGELIIETCDQSGFIDMRNLPSGMYKVDISNNAYRGCLELMAMPGRMEYFAADGNLLSGPLDLSNLPETLWWLNLSHNPINTKVLHYGELPESLEEINLHCSGVMSVKSVRKGQKHA